VESSVSLITLQVGRVVIYGREVLSPFLEDIDAEHRWRRNGRFMGEWFSVVCPDGELGSAAYDDCVAITPEHFSLAFGRGWK
jgi:hypothetical protein